ncbi:MAG: hypothetical protein R2875_05580 [Desulfobacterales bacterium]
MKRQLKQLGFSYDWDQEVTTCTPEYYRWEQWLFIRMFQKSHVSQGICELVRSPARPCWPTNRWKPVPAGDAASQCARKNSPSGFQNHGLCQDLLDFCDQLPGWPDKVTTMQKNWIGKSTGAEIHFAVEDSDRNHYGIHHPARHGLGRHFYVSRTRHPMVEILSRNTSQAQAIVGFQERMAGENHSTRPLKL